MDPKRSAAIGRSLRELAQQDGQAWAESLRAELVAERRAAAGGWPGTLSEARARVQSVVRAWATANGRRVSSEQLDEVTQALYASARHQWLANCEPERDEDP